MREAEVQVYGNMVEFARLGGALCAMGPSFVRLLRIQTDPPGDKNREVHLGLPYQRGKKQRWYSWRRSSLSHPHSVLTVAFVFFRTPGQIEGSLFLTLLLWDAPAGGRAARRVASSMGPRSRASRRRRMTTSAVRPTWDHKRYNLPRCSAARSGRWWCYPGNAGEQRLICNRLN